MSHIVKKDDMDYTFNEGEMRQGLFMSAVKNEAFDNHHQEDFDLRNQAQGNFLNDISGGNPFGVVSPITKPPLRSELPFSNAFEHNMNLTMEMQRMVNEHLQMEEYPGVDEVAAHFEMEFMQEDQQPLGGQDVFNLDHDFGDAAAAIPMQKRGA